MSDQVQEENEEEEFFLNEEDIVRIISLDEDGNPELDSGDEDVEMDVDKEGEDGEASAPVPVDDAELVFTGHKDSVFCVQVDPKTCQLAVTGGQDDKAVVWNVKTGETLFECTGHKESVTSVGWSHDGTYVATADLSGVVKVWNIATKEEVWSFETGDVEWLKWHPVAHVLLVGTVDGQVWMWKIPGGDTKMFTGHGSGVVSGAIMPDGMRACIGYEDGAVKLWDLKSGNCLHTTTAYDGHTSSVVCLHAHPNNNVVMSGSTDSTAKLLNTSNGKILSTYDCRSHHTGSDDDDNSVETVGLSNVGTYAATGTLGGVMAVWDVSTHIIRHQCVHGAGVVKLKWDASAPLIYTACLDGVVRLWDSRTGKEESRWSGHLTAIMDFDITSDGNNLVTVSEDQTARVFSLHTPDR